MIFKQHQKRYYLPQPQKFEDGGIIDANPTVESEQQPEEQSEEAIEDEVEVVKPREKSFFEKIADKLLGKGFPKSIKNWLKTNGDKKIVSIELGRLPVQKTIGILVNLITNGAYNKVKKDAGYDNWFHLFMIVELEDGKKYRVEKNQTLKIDNYKKSKNEDNIIVPNVANKNLTMNIMFNNAISKFGEDRIFDYDAFSQNCQLFIRDMLNSSKLLTIPTKAFIMQDAANLGKQVAKENKNLVKNITSIGNYVDRFLQNISNGIIRLEKGGIVKNKNRKRKIEK
jgi:hypothetical protein